MFGAVYRLLEQIGYWHPIHPTEVHMPIGLIVGALILRLAATLFGRPAFSQAAHYCTVLALIFLFPTILFGFMDWQHFYDGAWLRPIQIKITLAAVLLLLVSASVFFVQKRPTWPRIATASYVASFLVVVALGYFGGNLVYAGNKTKVAAAYAPGLAIFEQNCASCHADGGNAVDPSLPLLNSSYARTPASLLAFIRSPRHPNGTAGPMQSFSPAQISDQQSTELYNYITHGLGH